jgi:hypothetical protein
VYPNHHYQIGKGGRVKVLPLGDSVAEAITPSALAGLEDRIRDDLRMALHLIKHAENLGQLATTRAVALTRLPTKEASDFHYGTNATGVTLRAIDDNGAKIAVGDTAPSLNAVLSVAILAVGLSLKEATKP